MSLIGGAGRDPEVNEMDAYIADQVHPTWWQRLLRRLKHGTHEPEA